MAFSPYTQRLLLLINIRKLNKCREFHIVTKIMSVRKTRIYFTLLLLSFSLSACQFEKPNYDAHLEPFTKNFASTTGYWLLEPTETFLMPEILTEISGLAMVNDSTVACVQDETGILFFFNLNDGKIIERVRVAGSGDYEGIAITENHTFLLKSNGNLYKYSASEGTTERIKTPLKRDNNAEGLAYDSANNRLLIACKGKAGIEEEKIKGRAIYSYDLSNGFQSKPAFVITPEDLETWEEDQAQPLNLSPRRKSFMPSGVAVHPLTNQIYLLANVGRMLIVLDPDGKINNCLPLSPRVFRQPEGICFSSTGNLIIANEGQDGNGKIQVFAHTSTNLESSK